LQAESARTLNHQRLEKHNIPSVIADFAEGNKAGFELLAPAAGRL
jgi:hypothetical protein